MGRRAVFAHDEALFARGGGNAEQAGDRDVEQFGKGAQITDRRLGNVALDLAHPADGFAQCCPPYPPKSAPAPYAGRADQHPSVRGLEGAGCAAPLPQ